ncbi:MAG: multicopper oxidase domain-containing protein [Flavobacteriales bacterium]|nr:multicopper oxidase domain-containing protein [Flavobacteriales bacterium]
MPRSIRVNINFDVPLDNIEVWELTNQSPVAHPPHIHDVQFTSWISTVPRHRPTSGVSKDVVLEPRRNRHGALHHPLRGLLQLRHAVHVPLPHVAP